MKIFVLLTILTLSLASIAIAGLDSDNMPDYVIAVYHFESTKQNDSGLTYTPDSGPRQLNASLLDDATLTDGGKYGKSLLLREQAKLGSGTRWSPTLSNNEFSIVAWIKLPKQLPQQEEALYFHLTMLGYIQTETKQTLVSSVSSSVKPDGNIIAGHVDFLKHGSTISIESQNQNVANNKWHHIAFTKYAKTYTLFIDGNDVAEHRSTESPEFLGNLTSIIIGNTRGLNLTGSVLIDDVGFFETGFSIYEIKGLYNSRLSTFLEEMSVTPEGRLTTTWGELKSQH